MAASSGGSSAERARRSPPSFNFAAHPLPRTLSPRTPGTRPMSAPVTRRLVVGLESEDGPHVGDVIPGRLKVVDELDDGQNRRGVAFAAVVRREIDDAVLVAGQAVQGQVVEAVFRLATGGEGEEEVLR